MRKKFLSFLLAMLSLFALLGCVEQTTTVQITLSLDKTEILMAIDSTYQIAHTLTGTDDSDNTVLTYSSSDGSVAMVSSLGQVSGIGAGNCFITVRYSEAVYATLTVSVSAGHTVVAPMKTVYALGEDLNLRGSALEIRDEFGTLVESIPLTQPMIITYDPNLTGSQIVEFIYRDVTYGFEIFILNQKQSASMFADLVILNQTMEVGEKLELMLTQEDVVTFLDLIDNVYDYDEISIYGLFTTPDGEVLKVSAFWYQEFEERITYTAVNPSNNLEGTVANTADDYDLILNYVETNAPQYRMRFLPESAGDYHCELVVSVDGRIIQTLDKAFTVAESETDYKGFIKVDEVNKRHFVFENGETYIPVGQNVGWYTSKDRKYYDYLNWFEKMGDVGMNYARVWMAAWGFSIFWDDIYNYDARQSNMTSLDRTIEIAEDNGIYIQLCLLHHGMFSAEVNPMWPNSTNTWYTAKYGANPYAEYLTGTGQFFTADLAKDTFKNQLEYIIARWGYSDNIMSFELFNEVDWIETYSAVSGSAWHQEMAAFIKANDPYGHMVTTSVKSDSFLSNVYKVFALDEIDYVNVHSYGIYNHLSTLPTKQNNGYEVFEKPIMYNEVGYSGNSGTDQYQKDPNNVTLRQELWAGAMGGGGGTGMNWWWESWIEPYDAYDEFEGIAKYLARINLVGDDYRVMVKNDADYHIATLSNSNCAYMGYIVDNRIYAYIYDTGYTLNNQTASLKSFVSFTVPTIAAGHYQVSYYDTLTGALIDQTAITLTNAGNMTVVLPNFSIDIALIIEPID